MKCSVEGLTQSEQQKFGELITNYADIISTADGDIGRTNKIKHQINTQDATPIKQPARRLPLHQHEEVRSMIDDDMPNQDVIEPAYGPWSSPIVLVKKKDGSSRFCIDFRRLNSVTRKDAHPLPRIDDTLDALAGAQWFSTINLASGYWQVEMEDRHWEKTAFVTPFGFTNSK